MIALDSVALAGDREIAGKYVREAEKLLAALRARLGDSGATVASGQRRWDDAYVYAFVGPGISRAVITAGYPGVTVEPDDAALDLVPDFVSGVVLDGWIQRDGAQAVCASFVPTDETIAMHGLPAGVQTSRRLAVELSEDVVARFRIPSSGPTPTQYRYVRATLFSGVMRKVVQLLLGFGRPPARSIYDRAPPPMARDPDDPPPAGASYEARVRSVGRQIRYDWGFSRTHGVTLGSDAKPWLVEISIQHGVIAMPLPMHDLVNTAAFRTKLDDMDDTDGLYALDALGGWPTGEPFPVGEALEMARSAGYLIQLLEPEDLDAFYACSAYGSSMGWAFSPRGDRADNTAWYMHEDGIKRGVWDAINIRIGATIAGPPSSGAGVKERLEQFASRAAYPWAVRKADRLTSTQVREVLDTGTAAEFWAALLAQECPPIASASASYRRMQTGLLWDPGIYQPHIQFPEPLLGYCVSFDMRPFPATLQLGNRRCDTPMHVYWRGDDLVVCSFYFEQRVRTDANSSDMEECMYVGTWQSETIVGGLRTPAMMYSTIHDDRADIAPSRRTERIVSRDIGYYRTFVSIDLSYPVLGTLVREKAFHKTTEIVSTENEMLETSIRVPFHDRCAHYYTVATGVSGRMRTFADSYPTLIDPQTYATWRNFGGWTNYQVDPPPPRFTTEHPAGCGPVTASTVWAADPLVISGCDEYAYEGPWAEVCQNAEQLQLNRRLPDGTLTIEHGGATVDSTTWLISEGADDPLLVQRFTQVPMNSTAWRVWFATSPDPRTGETQSIHTTCSVLGDTQSVQYDRKPNAVATNGDLLVFGLVLHSDMTVKPACYIGVIGG